MSEKYLHKPGYSRAGRLLKPSLKARENMSQQTGTSDVRPDMSKNSDVVDRSSRPQQAEGKNVNSNADSQTDNPSANNIMKDSESAATGNVSDPSKSFSDAIHNLSKMSKPSYPTSVKSECMKKSVKSGRSQKSERSGRSQKSVKSECSLNSSERQRALDRMKRKHEREMKALEEEARHKAEMTRIKQEQEIDDFEDSEYSSYAQSHQSSVQSSRTESWIQDQNQLKQAGHNVKNEHVSRELNPSPERKIRASSSAIPNQNFSAIPDQNYIAVPNQNHGAIPNQNYSAIPKQNHSAIPNQNYEAIPNQYSCSQNQNFGAFSSRHVEQFSSVPAYGHPPGQNDNNVFVNNVRQPRTRDEPCLVSDTGTPRDNHAARPARESAPSRRGGDWISNLDRTISQPEQSLPPQMAAAIVNMDWASLVIKPKYDGSPLDWVDFSLKFKNKIHDNVYLTKSQKLSLLQDSLGQTPKGRIFGYLWDAQFYELALQKLKKLYGDENAIVNSYILEVRNWSPKDKRSEVSELATIVSKMVQIFQVLGFEADLKSQSLLSDLITKLPESMRKSWGRYVQKYGPPDVSKFEQWLSQEEDALRLGGALQRTSISDQRRATSARSTNINVVQSSSSQAPSPPVPGSVASVPPAARQPAPPPPAPNPKCVFCASDEHYVEKCAQFHKKSAADRLNWYQKEKRCLRCSRSNHRTDRCLSRLRCTVSGCGKPHTPVLHDALVKDTARSQNKNEVSGGGTSEVPPHTAPSDDDSQASGTVEREQNAISSPLAPSRTKIFVQILPVRFHSSDGLTQSGFAMLDPGSQGSLITKRLTEKLNLRGPIRKLSIKNVAQDIKPVMSKLVSLMVSNPNDPNSQPIVVSEAWTLDTLNLPSQKLERDSSGATVWPHIADLQIPDIDGHQIDMLIGASCKLAFRKIDERPGPAGLPDGIYGPLGWSLLGGEDPDCLSDPQLSENYFAVQVNDHSSGDLALNDMTTKFWSIEDVGCKFSDTQELSMEDRDAIQKMDTETRQVDDKRYEVPMLFRDSTPKIENNAPQARARYAGLRRKLEKNNDLKSAYCSTMQQYITDGYLKKLSDQEASRSSDITRYLVHFSVVHPYKKKVRVVMDAALQYLGSSLNDHLVNGPFLTNLLVGVIMRFRIGRVALSADIKSMFYRVVVPEPMRDALRIFWSETLAAEPDVYAFQVHVFGAKCSPSCATYALRRCALDNSASFPDSATQEILRNFYVDDYLSSVESVEQAVEITKNVIAICANGGFQLTKWVSTSDQVLKAASATDGITAEIDLDLNDDPSSRVLGIHWHVKNDCLYFKLSRKDVKKFTKRALLSILCSVFDPLGFLAPFVVRGRVLIQQLWAIGVDWDDEITGNVATSFAGWIDELGEISKFTIPRKYWPPLLTPSHVSLHVFGDASEMAYASCCYIRVQTPSGETHVSFVMSRMRVAPLGKKCLSLPRLELQASVLCTRLYTLVQKELDLKIDESFFWTDSNTVLQYLNNKTRRFKTFVGNRVAEILSVSSADQWRHCPGDLNPSDLATRGMTMSDLSSDNNVWLHGPDFLWKIMDHWPDQPNVGEIESSDPEMRNPLVAKMELRVHRAEPIDPSSVSSLSKLLKHTAWCQRFVHNVIMNVRNPQNKLLSRFLTVAEIEKAKLFWLQNAQQDVYATELADLSKKGRVSLSSSLVKLRPFLDSKMNVMRVGGRIAEANVPYECRHQVILPKTHRLTELIIHDCHIRLMHCGTEVIMTELRKQYWIPSQRVAIKSIIKSCPPCKKELAKPVVPLMADLPPSRVTEQVWTHTGTDVFGPLMIKQARSRLKIWVLIFCCMSVRAVHFELIRTIDSDCFIMAYRRFISRRGRARHFYSDPGSNFTGAAPELKAALRRLNADPNFRQYMTAEGIEFHFNPPKASHMGGAWESLIKSAKRSLRIVLQDKIVHFDTLHTTLCEIESAMNSRPLSYVSDETGISPLTPNHFLHHSATVVTPPNLSHDNDHLSKKRWLQSQLISQHLWQRWRREYLPNLTLASKWHRDTRNLAVDDVVLLSDHSAPRGCWPLGRVCEVNLSRDGRVRSAKIKTKNGVLVRPASQICLLEEAAKNDK